MKDHNDENPHFFGEGALFGSSLLQRALPLNPGERAERAANEGEVHSTDIISTVLLSSSYLCFLLELRLRLEDTSCVHTLLIDNTDSFTWNLAQQIRSLGTACDVVSRTEITISDIKKMKPDRIILSPGPGGPSDAKVSCHVLQKLSSEVPILGVCLGHQCMAHIFGGASYVGRAKNIMHGKTSAISHTKESIFQGIPSPFTAARYHSLIVGKLPKDFEPLAWTGSGVKREIMAMKHVIYPLFGVQFHPESFLTQHGHTLMKNFLNGTW